MRTKSKDGCFETAIDITQVEVFLSEKELHLLLGGELVGCKHNDKTSPATFYISIKKEETNGTEKK